MPNDVTMSEKDMQLHIDYRSKATSLLAENANFFGTNPTSKAKAIFPVNGNTTFEEIGCVGYQPVLEELTATIKIKRATGYSGNLCSPGSKEYVRFFLDYGDGVWHDMGMTAVNVHDIPDTKDCSGLLEKPLSYVVRQKIDPKHLLCSKPNLPKVRAILSWNIPLAANVPNPTVIWGHSKEVHVQIAPLQILSPLFPIDKIGPLLNKAILNPNISLSGLAAASTTDTKKLAEAQQAVTAPKIEIAELNKEYTAAKLNVEPERIGTKILAETVMSNNSALMASNKTVFANAGLNWEAALQKFVALKGNVSYEELYCVGIDYQKEALVATLRVKKNAGYNGSLCTNGSKEYVGFWIQSQPGCQWEYVGNAFVNVYDITMSADGLSYSVVLPVDLSKYRKPCGTPVILKVRGVLSWNVAPSTTDHDKVPYWGNIVDSYAQVMPGKGWDGKKPVMITLGGVSVDNINTVSGLTKPGAVIEINQTPTYNNSGFGGIIVMQGLSDPLKGTRYRVKVHNLNTNQSYYLNNTLHLLGYDPATNQIIHPIVTPDVNGYYVYQSYLNNIDSVLANFTPGTNDLLEITLENENGATDVHRIQMDNTVPQITLAADKSGCGGYAKGEHITGTFSVSDANLLNYTLSSSLAPNVYSGTTSIGVTNFDFNTAGSTSPCGSINLSATEKTIWNSVSPGYTVYASVVVCLK